MPLQHGEISKDHLASLGVGRAVARRAQLGGVNQTDWLSRALAQRARIRQRRASTAGAVCLHTSEVIIRVSSGGSGRERSTLGVRSDVLLWVALQASLMAECFADRAGDAEGGVGVSTLVGASPVSKHAVDCDSGLRHASRSS